jgi:hypothetical protein
MTGGPSRAVRRPGDPRPDRYFEHALWRIHGQVPSSGDRKPAIYAGEWPCGCVGDGRTHNPAIMGHAPSAETDNLCSATLRDPATVSRS